jgi:hypothetical protein
LQSSDEKNNRKENFFMNVFCEGKVASHAEAGKVSLVFYSDIAATHKVGAATLTDTEIYIDTTYTSLTEEKAIKNEEFILMTLKYQSTTLEAASYAMQALIAMDATSLSFYKLK